MLNYWDITISLQHGMKIPIVFSTKIIKKI